MMQQRFIKQIPHLQGAPKMHADLATINLPTQIDISLNDIIENWDLSFWEADFTPLEDKLFKKICHTFKRPYDPDDSILSFLRIDLQKFQSAASQIKQLYSQYKDKKGNIPENIHSILRKDLDSITKNLDEYTDIFSFLHLPEINMVTEDLINSLLFRLTKNSDLSYKNLSNTKDGCLFLKRLIPLLKLPSKFAPSDALIHNLVCTLGYFYTALSGKKVKRSYDPITKRDSGGFYNFVHLVLAEHPYFGKMLKTKNLAGIIRKYCEKRHAS